MTSSLSAVHATVSRRASFSRCRTYRYSLTRQFSDGQGVCMMIGLNPSVADHKQDDPTIRRCMQFAYDWGFQELVMVNLFAFCATHPEDLKRAAHPVGPRNMRTLKHQASRAERIVAAWGVHGTHRDQDRRVIRALSNHTLQCFGRTKKGEPLHPLYQKREASVSNYRGK